MIRRRPKGQVFRGRYRDGGPRAQVGLRLLCRVGTESSAHSPAKRGPDILGWQICCQCPALRSPRAHETDVGGSADAVLVNLTS